MAITVVSTDSTENYDTAPDTSTLTSFEVTTGTSLIALISTRELDEGDRDITGITFGDQNFTKVVAADDNAQLRCEVWYLHDPDVETNDIVASGFGNIGFIGMGVIECTGLDRTTGAEDNAEDIDSGPAFLDDPSVDLTHAGDALLVAAGADDNGGGVTNGSGQTSVYKFDSTRTRWGSYKIVTGGATSTMTDGPNGTASDFVYLGAAFPEEDAGVTVTAQDIVLGALVVDNATITQTHVLTAQDIVLGALVVDNATLTQTHVLTAADIVLGTPTADNATLTQTHVLVADDIVLGALTVDNADITAGVQIDAQDTTLGALTVDTASITQTHVLTAQDIVLGALVVDNGSITVDSEVEITAQDIVLGTLVVDNATLTQTHVLVADDIVLGALVVDNATLSIGALIYPQLTATTVTGRWTATAPTCHWTATAPTCHWTATQITRTT